MHYRPYSSYTPYSAYGKQVEAEAAKQGMAERAVDVSEEVEGSVDKAAGDLWYGSYK
jgi:hypothetical protein